MGRKRRTFNPTDKCRAVLWVWTEAKSQSEICREMSISLTLLARWQEMAMEGMMKALGGDHGRKKKDPALNGRLEKLMSRKQTKQKETEQAG